MQDDDEFQDDELSELAEQIQVGDNAEGARALGKIIEKAGGQRDIGAEVRRVQAQDRVQGEIKTALDDFAKKYPTIAKDDVLVDAGMTVLRREIKKDLEAVGIPAEKIEPLEKSSQHMIAAYAGLRAAGRPVRSPSELLDSAGEEMRRRFNIRAPTRNPREILREQRTARGFSNEPEHIGTDLPGGAAGTSARRGVVSAPVNTCTTCGARAALPPSSSRACNRPRPREGSSAATGGAGCRQAGVPTRCRRAARRSGRRRRALKLCAGTGRGSTSRTRARRAATRHRWSGGNGERHENADERTLKRRRSRHADRCPHRRHRGRRDADDRPGRLGPRGDQLHLRRGAASD